MGPPKIRITHVEVPPGAAVTARQLVIAFHLLRWGLPASVASVTAKLVTGEPGFAATLALVFAGLSPATAILTVIFVSHAIVGAAAAWVAFRHPLSGILLSFGMGLIAVLEWRELLRERGRDR